jgi:hypothetical protein
LEGNSLVLVVNDGFAGCAGAVDACFVAGVRVVDLLGVGLYCSSCGGVPDLLKMEATPEVIGFIRLLLLL